MLAIKDVDGNVEVAFDLMKRIATEYCAGNLEVDEMYDHRDTLLELYHKDKEDASDGAEGEEEGPEGEDAQRGAEGDDEYEGADGEEGSESEAPREQDRRTRTDT